ncbi:MAG TPA: hypothetical protein VFD90_07620 [Gaiellales bacterium]|jgi:hypothetical protein|nr:hypothetical protein [Gaiellales bacterium]
MATTPSRLSSRDDRLLPRALPAQCERKVNGSVGIGQDLFDYDEAVELAKLGRALKLPD